MDISPKTKTPTFPIKTLRIEKKNSLTLSLPPSQPTLHHHYHPINLCPSVPTIAHSATVAPVAFVALSA